MAIVQDDVVDWPSLLVAAVVGALAGLLLQNILYPSLARRIDSRKTRARAKSIDRAWTVVRTRSPRLELIQSGWSPDGTFTDETVRITLGSDFSLPEDLAPLRVRHAPAWSAEGFFDGEQIGVRNLRIRRLSDDPGRAAVGVSHLLEIDASAYRYFDFLATHALRLSGDCEERAVLNIRVDESHGDPSQLPWPTPLSVGLSLFCDDGDTLFVPRRTTKREGGGHWEAGRLFNAVGEGMNRRDFTPALDGHLRANPTVTAKRGLYEEVGLSGRWIEAAEIWMHSFALATDLLDYKFFGFAVTSMSRTEVEECWQNAPDRAEAQATGAAVFFDVRRRSAVHDLLRLVGTQQEEWSPEAVFCTIRSLLSRGIVSFQGVRRHLGGIRRA